MSSAAAVPATICTYTGRSIQPLNARPEDICIEDIAHSLSLQCRYWGHTCRFYSVAEHSVYVSRMVPPKHQLAALMHDASEAYLMDLVGPLKHLPEFAFYRRAEEQLMEVIGEALGFDHRMTFEIESADQEMLRIEMSELLHKPEQKEDIARHVGRFQSRLGNVEVAFLNRYEDLVTDRVLGAKRRRAG